MTMTLLERYDVDLDNNDENQDVTDVWNKIQNKVVQIMFAVGSLLLVIFI